MQIHELNTFRGDLGAGTFIAVDNGNDTGKLPVTEITEPLQEQIAQIITSPAPTEQEIIDARRGASGIVYDSLGNAIRGQIEYVDEKIDYVGEYILPQHNYTEGYYIQNDGTLVADEDYCVTDKIPLGQILNGLFWYGTYDAYKIKLVSFNENDEVVDYWGGSSGSEYRNVNNFGTGASYVRFSFNKGYQAKLTSSISGGSYITYWEVYTTGGLAADLQHNYSSITGEKPFENTASSLADGDDLAIDVDISVKKNKTYHFFMNIDNQFNTVYFGHGEGTYSYYFKLDGTNITFMTNGAEGSSFAHGLTLDTYIDVLLTVGDTGDGTLIINTLSGSYKRTVSVLQGYHGNVFIRPSGCDLTNVLISFASMDFRQPIWMFGDSYFTHTSNERWTYHLIEWGFARCMLNGFPGENAGESLPQVEAYIPAAGVPSFAVWCVGMNNPDTSTSINANWESATVQFINLCKTYAIEPVLATIPNVPNYSNYWKNQYVRNSGLRYIDFAKAVGAEEVGSSWYTGCLSLDNTHPTENGARLLCLQALQDLPELMLGNVL